MNQFWSQFWSHFGAILEPILESILELILELILEPILELNGGPNTRSRQQGRRATCHWLCYSNSSNNSIWGRIEVLIVVKYYLEKTRGAGLQGYSKPLLATGKNPIWNHIWGITPTSTPNMNYTNVDPKYKILRNPMRATSTTTTTTTTATIKTTTTAYNYYYYYYYYAVQQRKHRLLLPVLQLLLLILLLLQLLLLLLLLLLPLLLLHWINTHWRIVSVERKRSAQLQDAAILSHMTM